jgi:hypothetical protein
MTNTDMVVNKMDSLLQTLFWHGFDIHFLPGCLGTNNGTPAGRLPLTSGRTIGFGSPPGDHRLLQSPMTSDFFRCRLLQIFRGSESLIHNGAVVARSYCAAMISALMLTSGEAHDNRYLLNLLLDRDFGLYKNLDADTLIHHPQVADESILHPRP